MTNTQMRACIDFESGEILQQFRSNCQSVERAFQKFFAWCTVLCYVLQGVRGNNIRMVKMWWCNLVIIKMLRILFQNANGFCFIINFFSLVAYYKEIFNFKLFVDQKLKTIADNTSDLNYLTPSYFRVPRDAAERCHVIVF